jgi:hypothetical protein
MLQEAEAFEIAKLFLLLRFAFGFRLPVAIVNPTVAGVEIWLLLPLHGGVRDHGSATTRHEFRPLWGTRSHHGMISLAPLDRNQVQQMVAELSARHALPKEVIEGVSERTGGVPLFVEEVTRLLLERGEQGGIQAIPPTLQQSLTARLDRIGPAREVAQIGASVDRVTRTWGARND